MSNLPRQTACLIVLVGPPGSGKTTWTERYGAGAIHVSQDGLIAAITPHGFEHAYRPVYHEAENGIARAGLREARTVIVDRTNRTRAHRARWIDIAREFDYPALAVVMTTPEAECRARNARRDDASRLSEARMGRMFAAMEPVDTDEGFEAVFYGDANHVENWKELVVL